MWAMMSLSSLLVEGACAGPSAYSRCVSLAIGQTGSRIIDGVIVAAAVHRVLRMSANGPSRQFAAALLFGRFRGGTDIAWAALTLLAHALANMFGSFLIRAQSPYPFFCWRLRNRTPGPPPFSSMIRLRAAEPLVRRCGRQAQCR